jgi:hypothetical protein
MLAQGWASLPDERAPAPHPPDHPPEHAPDHPPDADDALAAVEPDAATAAADAATAAADGWPADGSAAEMGCDASAAEHELALAGAVAVAPCVAHVCARVLHVRSAHGHLLLTAETLRAHVRPEYWSGKTLEAQRPGLPPLLSFYGSQRFGHLVGGAQAAAGSARGAAAGPTGQNEFSTQVDDVR